LGFEAGTIPEYGGAPNGDSKLPFHIAIDFDDITGSAALPGRIKQHHGGQYAPCIYCRRGPPAHSSGKTLPDLNLAEAALGTIE
jgi:hypothetical protein